MGTPKKQRKTYERPFKRWDGARILEERKTANAFGLKNKREIYKVRNTLRKFRSEAKKLFTLTGATAEKEKKMLLERLYRLGLVEQGGSLDDVLGLTIDNLLDRRLESFVYRKGLAHTPKQARQMIVHGHISVGDTVVTVPSFFVEKGMETSIGFASASEFANPDHPIRQLPKKEDRKVLAEIKKEAPKAEETKIEKEVAETDAE